MSSAYIIAFRDGKPDTYLECRNSWGGAAYIWSALFDRFCRDPDREYDSWMSSTDRRLWDLVKEKRVPLHMRKVLASTFDNALVMPADFEQFAADLRAFKKDFERPNVACHMETWAKFVEEHLAADAIGFHHTSVSEDPWVTYVLPEDDEADSEYVPYDMNTGTRHWSAYGQEFIEE